MNPPQTPTPGPQWYPQPAQQARPRRVLPWVLALTAVLLVAAVVSVLGFVTPGWFTKETVDAAEAEADVRAVVPDQFAAFVSVRCPEGEPVEAGHTFVCTMTAAGRTAHARVTVPAGEEHPYDVEIVRETVLDARGVEKGVVEILGKDPTTVENVSCPEDQKVEKGHTFTCTATINGEPKKVPITVVDAESDPPQYRVDQPE